MRRKIKEGDLVLLFALEGNRNFLVRAEERNFSTDLGIVNLGELVGKKFGCTISSHIGKKFVALRPTVADFLGKKARMRPQAVRPKDTALILALTGVGPNAKVVEAGTGSAWLTIFLAYYLPKGKIYSYELREDFYENAKANVEASGLKNIVLKNKDVLEGIEEKDVDLVVLDMKRAEEAVGNAYSALKAGGWLVVYSPYIEQVKAVVSEINKYNFVQVATVENILRFWDVREHTLPKRHGLMHTGWLTFARKLC